MRAILAGLLLLSAAEPMTWLDDIRARAESDARAASEGRAQLTVSADDLVTIRRKVEFDVVKKSVTLENLRRHIGLRLAAVRSARRVEGYEACLAEPRVLAAGRDVGLEEVPGLLASEPDRARRRSILGAAAAARLAVLSEAQYAYLTESREIGRATGTTLPGFRSRHEEELSGLVDGARFILAETEEPYRWLLSEAVKDIHDGGDARAEDLLFLVHAPLAEALSPQVVEEAVGATLSALELAALAPRIDIAKSSMGARARSRVTPIDPPARVRVALSASSGVDGLRERLIATGIALTYVCGREADPFEARWLQSASVRSTYGFLLSSLASDAGWAAEMLKLSDSDQRRYLARACLARTLAARRLAAQCLFEDALRDPAQNALLAYATLHGQARGAPMSAEEAAEYVDALRAEMVPELTSCGLAARAEKSLRLAHGDAWWKAPAAARKVREGLARAGYETTNDLVNRYRAQRDDARTLSEMLLLQARAAGYPGS